MAKLKGKAKIKFLKRMALGRKNAAKKTKSKPKQLKKVTKRVTKKRKTAKINKPKTRRKTMVSRRRNISRRTRKGGLKIGNSLKTGIIGEVVKGIGAGSLVGMVMNRVLPNSNITPIASTAAAFLAGGVVGGASQVVLSGGLANFGGMFGGSQTVTAQTEMGV